MESKVLLQSPRQELDMAKKRLQEDSSAAILAKTKHPKKHSKQDFSALQLNKSKISSEKPLTTYTHIISMAQPIQFNNKTKEFFKCLRDHETNNFGDTPVVEMTEYHDDRLEINRKGNVRCAQNSDRIIKMLANQQGIYISDIEEKHLPNKKHINYGTILIWNDLSSKTGGIPVRVLYAVNHFLAWLLLHPEKSDDKKKEELTDSEDIIQ